MSVNLCSWKWTSLEDKLVLFGYLTVYDVGISFWWTETEKWASNFIIFSPIPIFISKSMGWMSEDLETWRCREAFKSSNATGASFSSKSKIISSSRRTDLVVVILLMYNSKESGNHSPVPWGTVFLNFFGHDSP